MSGIGDLVHTLVKHVWNSGPGNLGLNQIEQVPGQLWQSLDPRHPANLLNLAGMFAGGPKGMDEAMGGWVEPYNFPKAMSSGQLTWREGLPHETAMALRRHQVARAIQKNPGYDAISKQNAGAANTQALQALHDMLFGGETWMTPGNSIPRRPGL